MFNKKLNIYLLIKPCTDVFWFPVITDEFADDLIELVETNGQWSGGNNNNKVNKACDL